MTKEEAWKIIEECRSWNTSQSGFSKEEAAILEAKRKALARAWEVVGEVAK